MKWRRCTNCRNARAKANWRVRPLGIHPASAAFHKICTRRLCPPENRRLVRGSNRSTKVTVGPTCTTDSICHRKEGLRYPVIVEYAGNKWRTSPGTDEGSNLGYGISGGTGVIWVCMPFVDAENSRNAVSWWGDVGATVAYCKTTVKQTYDEFGGDPESVFIAGKQSGALCPRSIGNNWRRGARRSVAEGPCPARTVP